MRKLFSPDHSTSPWPAVFPFSILWRQIPENSDPVQHLEFSLDQNINFISKLKSLSSRLNLRLWPGSWNRERQLVSSVYFFGTFSATSAFLCYLSISGFPSPLNVTGLSKGAGVRWKCEGQLPKCWSLYFLCILQNPISQRFPNIDKHSMADIFLLTSLAPGWLPDAVLRVQFPWHRRPLRPPLDPWNICTSLSCKTLMEQAALLLPSLACCCGFLEYFSIRFCACIMLSKFHNTHVKFS